MNVHICIHTEAHQDLCMYVLSHYVYMCIHIRIYWRVATWFYTLQLSRLTHVWGDASVCDTTLTWREWLIHMWHDSYVTWYASHICDMTHPFVTRLLRDVNNSFVCDTTLMWHDVPHTYVTHPFVHNSERWGAGVEYHFQEI